MPRIDVSKSHLDVFLYRQGLHAKFNNSEAEFKKMIAWIEQQNGYAAHEVLFAFEHTGLYSLPLSLFLHEVQYKFTLIPGLDRIAEAIEAIYGHCQREK